VSGLPTRTLKVGQRLYRICRIDRHPLWFGPGEGNPPKYRFDSPDGSYGVCYLARTPIGAFVEAFMRDPAPLDGEGRLLAFSELAARHCVEVELASPLRFGVLRGRGLSWRGLTAAISSSAIYGESRAVSAGVHAEPTNLAGIEYRCRHDDDEIAYAIFDRASSRLKVIEGSAVSCVDIADTLRGYYPFVMTAEG
jgi:hypothetical protein